MFCSFTGNWLNPVRCLLVCFPGDFSPFKLPSGAFFSLRCLIYKVHAVPGGTLLLYKTSSRLSRTFFRRFLTSDPISYDQQLFKFTTLRKLCQELFSEVFELSLLCRMRQLFYVTTSCVYCQVLFSFSLCRSAHRGDSLIRLPYPLPFVNYFFQVF